MQAASFYSPRNLYMLTLETISDPLIFKKVNCLILSGHDFIPVSCFSGVLPAMVLDGESLVNSFPISLIGPSRELFLLNSHQLQRLCPHSLSQIWVHSSWALGTQALLQGTEMITQNCKDTTLSSQPITFLLHWKGHSEKNNNNKVKQRRDFSRLNIAHTFHGLPHERCTGSLKGRQLLL